MSETERARNTRRWLQYAQEDLDAARKLFGEDDFIPRQVCFFAQQAGEKSLKAALVSLEIDFPKSHDLTMLHSLLPSNRQSTIGLDRLDELSEWAVESRYPGDWPDATDSDARLAVEVAESLVRQMHAALTLSPGS